MTQVPTDIRAESDRQLLAIDWGDKQVEYPFAWLRGQCDCARCVNEWTGEAILNPNTIPADICVEKMELVGGYAVRIYWSDGHNSGLYTWEKLVSLNPPK